MLRLFQIRNIWGKQFGQFHFHSYIWYELILKNNERFDTFILFEDQLNVSLKSDCKYFRTYFQMKMVKKIFVRYLPHEGGLWQKCYFLLFLLAQADWPTHKISDLSDPPFMFFANNFANIWRDIYDNKTIKDGDIAPWKDFKKEKRKRNQIRPYFEMGRIVKRLHFLRRPFPKISPRIPQDFPKISTRFPQDFPRFLQDF